MYHIIDHNANTWNDGNYDKQKKKNKSAHKHRRVWRCAVFNICYTAHGGEKSSEENHKIKENTNKRKEGENT